MKTSAYAPDSTWVFRAWVPSRLNATLWPGYAALKACPIAGEAPVREAAVKTTRLPGDAVSTGFGALVVVTGVAAAVAAGAVVAVGTTAAAVVTSTAGAGVVTADCAGDEVHPASRTVVISKPIMILPRAIFFIVGDCFMGNSTCVRIL